MYLQCHRRFRRAPQEAAIALHEPVLHGHLLASIPNGYILESFANPDRDPFWFELYDRKPRIETAATVSAAIPARVPQRTG